jgi:hypothetical protein
MTLVEELETIATAAGALSGPEEHVVAVLPTEARAGRRVYLCAFGGADGEAETWLALDADGRPVVEREIVRDAVSIAAMCELAEETAAGGDLDDLRSQLVALRIAENPPGLDEAESAVDELERVLGAPPQLATTARLDAIGQATRALELALGGELQGSPFAQAMKNAPIVVDQLTADVEGSYRGPLS